MIAYHWSDISIDVKIPKTRRYLKTDDRDSRANLDDLEKPRGTTKLVVSAG